MTRAQDIYTNADQASRYDNSHVSRELFIKAQQLSRLMAEIAELAKELDANGNAPTREAAQNILAAVA